MLLTGEVMLIRPPAPPPGGCYHRDVQADTGLAISESKDRAWAMGLGWDRAAIETQKQ